MSRLQLWGKRGKAVKECKQGNYFRTILWAFLATMGLNVDLSPTSNLDAFLIEGQTLAFFQERHGSLHGIIISAATIFAGFSGNSILWLCIFFALCFLFFRAAQVQDKRICKAAAVQAAIFSLLYVVGFSISNYHSLITICGSAMALLKSLIAFMGIGLLFHALITLFLQKVLITGFDMGMERPLFIAQRKSFWLRVAIILACWLPYFLAFLPGALPFDTIDQLAQVMKDAPLSALNPLFMTGVFYLFMHIGLLLGSANVGMVLFTLCQMFIVAMAFSYCISFMAKQKANNHILMFSFIFFALYPPHAFYALTIFKDTFFAVAILLLTLKTVEMLQDPAVFFAGKKNWIILSLLCAATFLVRNNGLYIIAIYLPAVLLIFRAYWKKILPIIGVCVFFFISLNLTATALGASGTSVAEVLSVPLQQVARIVRDHGDTLAEEDKELITCILPYDELPRLYNPILSDPVKSWRSFDEAAFSQDKATYAALWGRLILEYPQTALEAFLCQTHGYWYPDTEGGIALRAIEDNPYGIYRVHILPDPVTDALAGIMVIRSLPVFAMLFSIGFAVWITALLALILALKGEKRMLLAFLPICLLWLSCLLSPASGMYRYIYGLFMALPLFLAIALSKSESSEAGACG